MSCFPFRLTKSLNLLIMKKKWLKKEEQLRQELKKDNPISTKVDQIFTSSGASRVLINDLLTIMEESKEIVIELVVFNLPKGISVEPVDDDIYHWNAKLRF